MSAPRIEVRLDRLDYNARTLVDRLASRGVAVTGIVKATLGTPEVARVMQRAGVAAIGDSRIENIERLRAAGVTGPMTLIRSPMPSQANRVVASADLSLNTEVEVLDRLSQAAVEQGRPHGVVLMVELGDLREGILPSDLPTVARHALGLPGIVLRGIGTNLACQSGVAPDDRNMTELSDLVESLQSSLGITIDLVSGGNSANLAWLLGGGEVGRVNDLRLGESILLGREPLDRTVIEGLRTDVFTIVAEVIESKDKPTLPWGDVHQGAFGAVAGMADRGVRARVIVALGRQDVDPEGLTPPAGMAIIGSSSDHLLLDPGTAHLSTGDEVAFQLDYSALLRAMTSPFVDQVMLDPVGAGVGPTQAGTGSNRT